MTDVGDAVDATLPPPAGPPVDSFGEGFGEPPVPPGSDSGSWFVRRAMLLAGLAALVGLLLALVGIVSFASSSDDRRAADELQAETGDLDAEAEGLRAEAENVRAEADEADLEADDIASAEAAVDEGLDAMLASFFGTTVAHNVLVECENEAVDANSFSAARDCYVLLLETVVNETEADRDVLESLTNDADELEAVTP